MLTRGLTAVALLVAVPADGGRYTVVTRVREMARSADGRYALGAKAR